MRVEEFKKLSKKELRQRANDAFAESESSLGGMVRQSELYDQARFYMDEIDRRHDSFVSIRDLLLEIGVILLIGWEIHMGYTQEANQASQFTQQSQVMTNLQTSSDKTAQILTTMNEYVKKELELYYEPSVVVSKVHQNGRDVLEVRNNGRTSITIFGVKARNDVCKLETPMKVSSTGSGVLESSFILDRTLETVVSSGGSSLLTLYFKAENGTEYKHESLVNRLPIVEGAGVGIQYPNTEPSEWNRELAKPSVGKCPK
jgi:hypothetical protein